MKLAGVRIRLLLAAFAAVIVLSVGIWHLSKQRCFQFVGSVTCRVETNERIVALSFDDGPTPLGVNAILPVLEKYNVKATFFLIGKFMAEHPELAPKLQKAGHELGNHSYSHVWMMGHWPSWYDREIADTHKILTAAGAKPVLFRPPFGKKMIGLPMAVERNGYRSVTWDVADGFPDMIDGPSYAAHILKQVKPGSIILMHPMYQHSQPARDALPLILEGLAKQGYRIVPVGALLKLE